MKEFIQKLRQNEYIREKQLSDIISSFNFTRQAFFNAKWNEMTTIARGLFIDVKNEKIVARSYPKFFNLNEAVSTNKSIFELQYPITAYKKYNGFLGILSWNYETNDFFAASKSSNQGDFANYFSNLLLATINKNNNKDVLAKYIQENNVSFIFEVIDVVNDPHIVKYENSQIVLLDIIKNELQFNKLSYAELKEVGMKFGFNVKEQQYIFNTTDELQQFFNEVNESKNFENIEGWVFEDSNKFMFKYKVPFYLYWKNVRGLKNRYCNQIEKIGQFKICNQKEDEIIFIPLFDKICSIIGFDNFKNLSVIELRDMIKN